MAGDATVAGHGLLPRHVVAPSFRVEVIAVGAPRVDDVTRHES